MTKKDIVRVISEELGLTQQETKEVVQRTFDSIIETLVREGRIELRNFGVFEVKSRAARRARNPKTGQKVDVPEKFVVSFKPGKVMEQRVRDSGHISFPEPTIDWSGEADRQDSTAGSPPRGASGKSDSSGPAGTNSLRMSPSGRWDETS